MTTPLRNTAHVNARSRLMVALDLPTARDARRIVDQLDARVDVFKVGLELFTRTRLELSVNCNRATNRYSLISRFSMLVRLSSAQ